MANLRVDKITSTETFETTGSVQFDGSGDALNVSSSDDFSFGTGDFTVEAWVLSNGYSGSHQVISITDGTENWQFFRHSGGTLRWNSRGTGDSGTVAYNADEDLEIGTWHHVAATRNDNTLRLFKNGILVGTFVGYTSDLTLSTSGPSIGIWDGDNSSEPWNGHISNVRVIKGKALYTENFKPPMRELEVTPETVLLACQHKTDASHEKTGKTITVTGNAVANELTPGLLTDIVKSGGNSAITGSVEFDGTGDYLEVDLSTDAIGTDEFTIEMWVNPGETSFTNNRRLIRIGPNNNANNIQILYNAEKSNFEVDNGTNELVNPGITTVATQSWSHVALTRQGTDNLKLFVNGVEDTATTTSADISQTTVQIGDDSTVSSVGLIGFISNLRIVKGTALYTDDFIPPTRELKKVPGTVLLCCQDSNDPTTEATGKTITGFGDLDQSYGVDLLTNGQFNADSDWTKGPQWTIVGGAASITDSPNRTSDSVLSQDASSWIQAGRVYRVAVDWSFTNGDFDIGIGSSTSALREFSINSSHSSPYFFNLVADDDDQLVHIVANQHAVGDINSISIEKLPPAKVGSDFTPQVGNDGSVEFVGPTKINTENYFYLPTGDTESRTLNVATQASSSARGLFGHGLNPSADVNTIEFITIASTGDAIDFGDLNNALRLSGSCSSSTRGLWGGGFPSTNVIDYVTISSKGDAQDFGDLIAARLGLAGCSNSTRGLFAGGRTVNTIDYVTIASTGDAKDFGDLTVARSDFEGTGCASPTRGVWAGGYTPTILNTIDYVTIATTGNATDFGDTRATRVACTSCSNSTRGLIAGGLAPTRTNNIDYITISTTGNSLEFGELTDDILSLSGCSSTIRGVFAGGQDPAVVSTIQYVNIASTGNAVSFGNLTESKRSLTACSSGHGGLG